MKPTLSALQKDLKGTSSPAQAKISAWFFRTGPGEYGAGDTFIGIKVPVQRQIAAKYRGLSLLDIEKLLHSPIHEYRLTALIMLSNTFKRAETKEQKAIVALFVKNRRFVNNWDLVDTSAPAILGVWLLNRPKSLLYQFARSKNVWERRIAMVTTQTFIRHGQLSDTVAIAKILLSDQHDLIHKVVGWMLREVGDRDRATLKAFLTVYAGVMPRTMLRYAIEHLPAPERQRILNR